MAKALNPNSGRQQIMKVIFDNKGPITPAQITAKLKEQGIEIKYLHSHLNYFKSHGQLIHREDKAYELADKMNVRLIALYNGETAATEPTDPVETFFDLLEGSQEVDFAAIIGQEVEEVEEKELVEVN